MPTIVNGSQFMQAVLYTGTGATQTIAVGFQPDFVWIKSRSSATDNKLTDSVRGVTKGLISNSTGAETTDTNGLTAFTSNGFTVGSDSVYNASGQTYVAWSWKASNAAAVTNTAGSITSQVSANTTAGFSVVTYTGTGSAATVGHGLGVAPSMVIVKNRATAATSWIVYHASLSNTQALYLNTTDAALTSNLYWNNTSPTSSVFSVAAYNPTNQASTNIVAYCFAAIAGYSAFGSYTGNGSSDGPFVYLGFRPRWVLLKRSNTSGTVWGLVDSARDTYNLAGQLLEPNLSYAEYTPASAGYPIDLLSNGFKLRSSDVGENNSGDTYIYAAFAENPFTVALAR